MNLLIPANVARTQRRHFSAHVTPPHTHNTHFLRTDFQEKKSTPGQVQITGTTVLGRKGPTQQKPSNKNQDESKTHI